MKNCHYQQIASKALKTSILLKSRSIARYIPETKWYQPKNLTYMLNKYPVVYVKPDKGTGGEGIIRIRRRLGNRVNISDLYDEQIVRSHQLMDCLKQKLSYRKPYILQQGISLAQMGNYPFDIRVLLQKPMDQWLISGMAAKLASPGRIVTNYCKGGKPCDIHKAIYEATHRDHEKTKKILVELYYLSKEIAKILNRRFVGLRELGIDVGIDKQQQIWIFEVNTQPNFQMFKKLTDHQMYQIIRRRHRQIAS